MAMHLANAISYITDGEKTQEGALVGSHNCNVDTALQEMISVKRKYGKLDKRQGYHFIISFQFHQFQEILITVGKRNGILHI